MLHALTDTWTLVSNLYISVLNLEYLSSKETSKGLLMGRAKKDPKGGGLTEQRLYGGGKG